MIYDNEDAGDLRAFGEADYAAEMNADRAHASRADYIEAFDNLTASGYYGGFPHALMAGPRQRPVCDECEAELRRETPGVFNDPDYLIFCSEQCSEEHGDSMGGDYFYEPQEDFLADLGCGPCYYD